jgi:hypothetical protein
MYNVKVHVTNCTFIWSIRYDDVEETGNLHVVHALFMKPVDSLLCSQELNWVQTILSHPTSSRSLSGNSKLKERFWEERIVYIPWYSTDRIEYNASNTSSIISCIRSAVTFWLSRCLATTGWYTIDTDWWGYMKYAIGMDIYPRLHKDWLGVSEVNRGDTRHPNTMVIA